MNVRKKLGQHITKFTNRSHKSIKISVFGSLKLIKITIIHKFHVTTYNLIPAYMQRSQNLGSDTNLMQDDYDVTQIFMIFKGRNVGETQI